VARESLEGIGMNAAAIDCYPNGERVPGHTPAIVGAILFEAMGALYAVLVELETEIENTRAAAGLCPSRRQRRGLEMLVEHYEQQHAKLARFFDSDAYLDRVSVLS
jgi:hypothetical protein